MTADTGRRSQWWERPFEMFQTNLREIDAGLDVEATLDVIAEHGADTWLINAGGIIANYPTTLPFHTRNSHLDQRPGGDLLGDAVAGAHARGIRLMARMDFSKVALPVADDHPQWCFRSSAGQRQTIEGLVSVCPNGGYYQRCTFKILDEILDRYPVDGFFFNWFGFNEVDYHGIRHGVCHCDNCRAAFTAASGSELPADEDDPAFPHWRAFCRTVLNDLTGRIRDHIAARRPDAPLILGSRSDIVFHEANNKIGRELWPSATAEAVSAAKTVRPDKPVLVNSTVFVDMPYRMAAEDPNHVGQFFAQAVARGANPSTYIMGPPGAIGYPGMAAAAEVTRFHRDHRSVYDGLSPAAEVMLVRPDALTQPAEALEEFRGWYAALQQGHLCFDVLPLERFVEAVEGSDLSRYRAAILPDLGELSAEVCAGLTGLVQHGCAMITSGSTALNDDGVQVPWLPAVGFGDRHRGFAATRSSYASDGDSVIAIYGDQWDLELAPDATAAWWVLPQSGFAPPEKAYGHRRSELPAVAVRDIAGRVVQFSWTIGCTYREFGTGDVRRLMVDQVSRAAGEQPVAVVEVAEQLELIVGRSSAGTVVHLINLGGAGRRGFGSPIPIRGGRLRLRGAVTEVRSLRTGAACAVRADGDITEVELPEIHLFDALLIAT